MLEGERREKGKRRQEGLNCEEDCKLRRRVIKVGKEKTKKAEREEERKDSRREEYGTKERREKKGKNVGGEGGDECGRWAAKGP